MGAAEDSLEGEELDVFRWRYQQARDVGLSRNAAELFALGDGDLELLRHARADGCPTQTAAEIFT